MNGNDFLDKMELVDEKFVQQANEPAKTGRSIPARFCAIAACCALMLAVGYRALPGSTIGLQPQTGDSSLSPLPGSEPTESPVPEPFKQLPAYPKPLVLPSSDLPEPQPFEWPDLQFSAMGYEGYWMKELDEFQTGNPWTPEMDFDTLPVYRNAVLYSKEQMTQSGNFEVMQDILLSVASRLGLDPEVLTMGSNGAAENQKQEIRAKHKECGLEPPDEAFFAPTYIYGEAEGIRIEVHINQDVRILFETPQPYPQELISGAAGFELAQKKASWLTKKYDALLDMEQPAVAIMGGDYSASLEQHYSMYAYDASQSDLEKIIHYNFYQAMFCDDDNGDLFLIWLRYPDLTNLLGDYPAITPEQARQELLDGRYFTSVPYDAFSAEDVAGVELVYHTQSYAPIYVPYYKFYVDISDAPEHFTAESRNGLREYGVYYVPAISSEYLSSLPLWDGHIN